MKLKRRQIMKQKAYQVAFSATLVVVMVAFLSAIFFVNANPSFAASGKKKPSAVDRTSAVEYTEAQIKQLQGALKITEAQQELWDNLTQVMRENAEDMDALTASLAKERAEGTKNINAVEHMKLHSQITKAHLDQLEKFIPPFEAFYDSLSDEQKKSTDTIFRTGIYGKAKRK
jgi:predicted PurR-regulated permease PerM